MKRNMIIAVVSLCVVIAAGILLYPKIFAPAPERKVLYWTDPMLPGDRSDHPGKSPMGMERVPVYAEDAASAESTVAKKIYYTCPMHPSVRKDGPGACPICGMTLVKMSEEVQEEKEEKSELGAVTLSATKQHLANIATVEVGRSALRHEIHAVGRIDYAEPNRKKISMRFPGRIERLYLTYTGQRVQSGDPVADVYSPEAISAQQEYLLAKDSYDTVMNENELISTGAKELLDQSRKKLLRWGFTPAQISALDVSRNPQGTLTIYSPIGGTVVRKNVEPQEYTSAGEDLFEVADLSTVWMYADVYEQDMRSVTVGQRIQASSDAYPGKSFTGRVTFISPAMDPASRTVRVRADVPNAGGELKIEMFVNVTISSTLSRAVVIPATALLSYGSRQIVWVQKKEGVFEPRNVTVGISAGGQTQILQGLNEGQRIVVSGGYLLDSESQMQDGSASPSAND